MLAPPRRLSPGPTPLQPPFRPKRFEFPDFMPLDVRKCQYCNTPIEGGDWKAQQVAPHNAYLPNSQWHLLCSFENY